MHSRRISAALSPILARRARRRSVGGVASLLAGAGAFAATLCILVAAPVAARQDPSDREMGPPETVADVDLARYAGVWYEIARFPNRFQRDCVGDVTATYTLRDDGRVRVVNRCRTDDGETVAEGVARRATEGGTAARLEVRFAPGWLSFLPFVWGDYWVLALADDYSWAVVGSPDREYLWLLSRTPRVEAQTYQRMVAAADAEGYVVERLARTPQR